MFKYIKLIYLGFLFTAYSHAASQPASLPVGVAKFDGAGIQISTTKDDLSNDNVLICSSMEKKCTPYNGSDFLKGEESSNVEDVSGGKTVFSFDYKKPVSAHYQSEVDVAFIYLKKENLPDIEFYKDNKFKVHRQGVDDIVSYCTSSEGVHVYSKSGSVHLYYSLGYDVEATCSSEVYE